MHIFRNLSMMLVVVLMAGMLPSTAASQPAGLTGLVFSPGSSPGRFKTIVTYFESGKTGILSGHVYNEIMNPIAGATVLAQPTGTVATSDSKGFYTMVLLAGFYDVTASMGDYMPQSVNGVVILADNTTNQDFHLTFPGAWTQISLPESCPDWTRLDAEYFPPTGKAYILGGQGGPSGGSTYGNIYSFDPVSQTCANTGKTMPVPISDYTIVTLNNGSADNLCTFGGRVSTGGYTTAVQCYDPVANTVSQVSTLPGDLGLYIPGGAAVVGNTAYVFGGFRNTSTPYHIGETWAWDPAANTWTQKSNVLFARGYIEVAVADGKIYGFGGDVFDGVNLFAQTEAEVFDPATGNWNYIAGLATASGEGRAFGFDTGSDFILAGKIVIAGGGQWPSESSEVLTYDIASGTYDSSFHDLNAMRRDHASFFVPGNPGVMWVFGGRSSAMGYGGDSPPYAPPEYRIVFQGHWDYLPLVLSASTRQ
jgi:hypothetical protein